MEDYYLPGTAGALNFLGRSVSTRSPIPITTGSGGWEKLGSGATRSGAAGQESANGNGADRGGAVTERAWRKRLGSNLPLVLLRGLAPLCRRSAATCPGSYHDGSTVPVLNHYGTGTVLNRSIRYCTCTVPYCIRIFVPYLLEYCTSTVVLSCTFSILMH